MRIHRGGAAPPSDDSSSDEEDFFSKKKAVAMRNKTKKDVHDQTITPPTTAINETSSNKRHHFHSNARAAKMDALLQELKETSANPTPLSERPPPEKMGSFVMPGEEQFTTNIFVGNLAPITTEEELTDVFRQFGDLYSVKIMWPRTSEERGNWMVLFD